MTSKGAWQARPRVGQRPCPSPVRQQRQAGPLCAGNREPLKDGEGEWLGRMSVSACPGSGALIRRIPQSMGEWNEGPMDLVALRPREALGCALESWLSLRS